MGKHLDNQLFVWSTRSVTNPRILNPLTKLTMVKRDGQIVGVRVTAPVRGRPLRVTQFSRDQDPAIFDFLCRLAAGRVVEAHLDEACMARLSEIGFLVEEKFIPTEPRFDCALDDVPASPLAQPSALAQFAQHRYAVLRALITVATLTALRAFYRAFVEQGFALFKDQHGTLRWWAHNEPVARAIQAQLTEIVSHVVGERVKPSYAYFASYCQEAVLARHRDREQCAFSVSLLIDYVPEPVGVSPWPLWLEVGENESVAISLGPGDGLVYRGTELPHWRDALPAGHASTSLLLHYVPVDFAGRLD